MALSNNPSVLGGGLPIPAGATGLVGGPSSATDNAIARFDGTTGKVVQDSAVTIADTSGNLTIATGTATVTLGAATETLAVAVTAAGAGTITPKSGQNLTLATAGAGGVVVSTDLQVSGGDIRLNGAAAAVTSSHKLIKKVTGIADNVATDILTVTVPNANHAALVKLTLLTSNGSTDAFESSRTSTGEVVLARTAGVATVAAATALVSQIATVGGGATHTTAVGVSAMTGAADAQQTFTIQVTVDDSGNLGSNQCVVLAELVNAEASGVTIA